ncbi:unnamed protein product [Linum tenue]|uniref:Uncharacterized protein n=1 Tax=Linum tenue TaxID=586396 RepID=A0AAV0IAX3_9ROSI|nr:unnamed protein product [Linum tenue]
MEVNILETTIVKAANDKEETSSPPGQRLWLSNLDLVHGRIHLPLLFLYKRDPNSLASHDFFDARLLKEALSQALVPFHPLAGRLARDEKGRIEVDCNDEGVLFREAEAPEIGLDEIDDFMPASELLKAELLKLLPSVDYSRGISSYPLLLLQVTRFRCGGVSLGIGTHHSLVDGESAMSLINAWANTARGFPPVVSPFLDRTILRARNPPAPKFHHSEYDPSPVLINGTPNRTENPTAMAVLTFTPDQLNALRKQVNPNQYSKSKAGYSTYQILTAHIWRCVSRARGLADDQPTRLHMSVDGRSRLTNPPVPTGYFGNMIFHATPTAVAGELVSEPIVRTLERIRRAIDRMDDEYLRSAIDYLEDPIDPNGVMQVPETCRSPNLKIISWIRLPFEFTDFGWGRPTDYRPASLFEGKGNLLPWNGDGSLSLAICLEADAMVSFQQLVHDVDSGWEKFTARL